MRGPESIRHQPRFPGVIPEPGAGCPRVTHPFAAPYQGGLPLRGRSLDLHVLSTPPAFVLSQDQTLRRKFNPAGLNPSGSISFVRFRVTRTRPRAEGPLPASHDGSALAFG